MQPKHAAHRVPVVDTLAAYWALLVASARQLSRHRTVGRHAVVAWRTEDPGFGADPEFVDTLKVMNADPVVRPEVRA